MEDNILRFKVVVDDLLLLVGQILQPRQDLRDDQFGFFLGELLVFLQIVVQIWSGTQLQNSAETVMIDLDSIIVLHYPSVCQFLVDLVLAECMLNVVIFDLVGPGIVKMMDFAGNFVTVFQIKGFVHF